MSNYTASTCRSLTVFIILSAKALQIMRAPGNVEAIGFSKVFHAHVYWGPLLLINTSAISCLEKMEHKALILLLILLRSILLFLNNASNTPLPVIT